MWRRRPVLQLFCRISAELCHQIGSHGCAKVAPGSPLSLGLWMAPLGRSYASSLRTPASREEGGPQEGSLDLNCVQT